MIKLRGMLASHAKGTLPQAPVCTAPSQAPYRLMSSTMGTTMQQEMQSLEQLRMVQHDAKNELLVLQGFLDRGENDQARAYLEELLRREPPDSNME